jgi:hypothetical protein
VPDRREASEDADVAGALVDLDLRVFVDEAAEAVTGVLNMRTGVSCCTL